METFAAIVRWEVRYYLRRISTWVYFGIFFGIAFLFMLALTGAFGDAVVMGTGGKVKANSPLTIAQILPLMSLLGVSITAALAGNALYRDYDAGIDPLIYSAPLTKPAFLGGRFAGSLIVNAFVLLGIGAGAAIACVTPWAHPERLASFDLASYVWPYVTHIYPNLLLTAAIFFSLVSLTRQMLPNYVGGAVLLIGYLLASSAISNLDNKWVGALVDPFGMRAMRYTTEYWTIAEKNELLVPLSGMLLSNRLLWIGIGLTIFAVAYSRFTFSHAVPQRAAAPVPPTPVGPIILDAPVRLSDLPAVAREYSPRAGLVQFQSIALRSFWRIVRNRYFATIVVAGLLYLVVAARAAGQLYGTTTWPVTYQMVEVLTGTFGVFLLVIIALYAGELVWSERDAKIAGIYDATPVGTALVYFAKLTALAGVIVVLQLVLMVAGMIMQAWAGYYRFEVPVYLQSLLGIQLVDLVLLAVLAMTVHVVVDNKYLGHFLVILLMIANGVQTYIGLEHKLLEFTSDGGTVYSDMNRWGPFLRSWFWWKAYWLAFAGLLLVLVHLFWVRGSETEPRWRLVLARRRLTGRVGTAAVGSGVAFAALGGFIYYNTNVLNLYRGPDETKELRISYERLYKRYETRPQPRIARVTVAVDLHPESQGFEARGRYVLRNADSVAIDTVVVTLSEDLARTIRFAGGSSHVLNDPSRSFHLYRLTEPLAPGDSTTMEFEVSLSPRGFTEQIENTSIVSNGTFLSNNLFMPGIGYEPSQELADEDARKRAKLPEKDRMRPPTDPRALRRSYVSSDADFVRYDATVSTVEGQMPITSGHLDSTWSANGRRYAHFVLDAPIINLWAFQSASYAVERDRWTAPDGKVVDIEIDYHPAHDFNVARMVQGVKESLDYFTRAFGPYQHQMVRIVEFPRYATFAQSLPNTIPYSEAIGFIARLGDPKDVDYPFYVTAHEVAHQWWAHQVIGADAQGATMLSETLSQYAAMMVMEKRFGHANMRRFLEYELDRYLIGRSNERRREMPLQLVENQQYIHYNKGSLAMYALRDYVGEERVNGALRGFIDAHRFRGPPYPTSLELVAALRAVTPDSLRYLITDLFETITLYELKTDSIVVTDTTEGRFRVDIYGTTRKVRADSLGVEVDARMNDWIEIGLFRNAERGDTLADKNGVPVYLAKHRLGPGAQRITVIASERPIRGGIDPLHKLIDRRVDDNTKGVYDRSQSRLASVKTPAKTTKKSP
ncbi:MAG TPA: M1 family aminopeptidase [Gemmatimonadaceae bacterium]|nr:M1 family aminopeptidase [Gemmatimonadaceae bacterium]